MQVSLKAKLTLLLMLLSSVATASFLLMANESHNALVGGKEDLVRASAEGMMDKIDRNLFERYGDVQAFSQSEPARSLDRKRIEAFMSDMMAAYAPIYDAMIVADKSGKVIAANTVDKNGKPASLKYLIGLDMSQENWFKAAIAGQIKSGNAFVEDAHIDKQLGTALSNDGKVMNFTSPIRVGDSIVGVWSNRMSWADVVATIVREESAKIKNERISAVGVALLDQKGTFLLNSENPERELKETRDDFKTLRELAAKTSYVHTQKAENTSVAQIEVVNNSRGYSSYPSQGWTAVISVSRSDHAIDFNIHVVYGTLAFLLLVNIACYLFVHRLGRNFERIVSNLFDSATNLRALSGSVQDSSQSLASASSQQGAAVEETVASSEEMRAMLGQTSQQARNCQEATDEGKRESASGKAVVARLAAAMDEIQSNNQRLDGMIRLINEIQVKTNVINDIVTETRLLSFNASIEAARAGAQGKGFAVVAEEVGKLASMSGKAAEEIRQLLGSSTREVVESVKVTQDRVRQGKDISDECERAFIQMSSALEKIESGVKMIVSATNEQQEGINQTNAAMSEMDRTSQTNSQGAELLASHSQSLNQGAQSLELTLQDLNRLVFARSATSIAAGEKSPPRQPMKDVTFHPSAKRPASPTTEAPASGTSRSDSRWRKAA